MRGLSTAMMHRIFLLVCVVAVRVTEKFVEYRHESDVSTYYYFCCVLCVLYGLVICE